MVIIIIFFFLTIQSSQQSFNKYLEIGEVIIKTSTFLIYMLVQEMFLFSVNF